MKKPVQRYMADKGTLMKLGAEDALFEGVSFIEVVPAADYNELLAELEALKKASPAVIKGSVGGGDVPSNTVYVTLDQQAPWPDLSIGTSVALVTGERCNSAELLPKDHVAIPLKPPKALLISMAIRSDHGLGVPGYYDQALFANQGISHAQRFDAEISSMRQLYEEVTGAGFYQHSNAQRYLDIAEQTVVMDQKKE